MRTILANKSDSGEESSYARCRLHNVCMTQRLIERTRTHIVPFQWKVWDYKRKWTRYLFTKERRTNSPKWCISTFKLAEETEVDQEESGRPDTHEDVKKLKRLTTW